MKLLPQVVLLFLSWLGLWLIYPGLNNSIWIFAVQISWLIGWRWLALPLVISFWVTAFVTLYCGLGMGLATGLEVLEDQLMKRKSKE